MCLNPIKIHNNRRDFYRALHPSDLYVPCGTCSECLDIKRSEYSLRAVYEAKRWSKFVMLLFTYSDQSMPYLYYDHDHIMCHYMPHISDMIDIVRRKYGKDNFAYLIGAEYGVDEQYTQRPHYHGLFMLSDSIDPAEFTEFCRKVWTGADYYKDKYQSYSWKYGNLGFMFPSANDVKLGKHLCRDAVKSAFYCAKYCVKQLGFINKPLVIKIKYDKQSRTIRDSTPRAMCSRGFGRNMVDDKSFDLSNGTVLNPLTRCLQPIPRSILDMVCYKRWFNGRVSKVYDIYGNLVTKKDGTPVLRRLYEREYTDEYEKFKMANLNKMISEKANDYKQFCDCAVLTDRAARELAIYHYVYKSVPLAALKTSGVNPSEMFSEQSYTRMYYITKIARYIDNCKHVAWDIEHYDVVYDPVEIRSVSHIETCDMLMDEDMLRLEEYLEDTILYYRYESMRERLAKMNNTAKYRNLTNPHG